MNLETLIQLLQCMREEFGAVAWVVLGIVLPTLIVLGMIALRYVVRGRLGMGSAQFFAEQREIDHRLRNR